MEKFPKIGLGILIEDSQGRILLAKRISAHGADSWGPPGGHLEFGETFEQCAIREVFEETALKIFNPKFIAITNDFFEKEQKHYVSIFMRADFPKGQQIVNMEPKKTSDWQWFAWNELPKNLFLPLANFIQLQLLDSSEFTFRRRYSLLS